MRRDRSINALFGLFVSAAVAAVALGTGLRVKDDFSRSSAERSIGFSKPVESRHLELE